MSKQFDQLSPDDYHPTFLHARREAAIIFVVWLVLLVWCVPYCYWNGFHQPIDARTVPMVMGIPSWVFWGVVAPWLAADLFTIWFCFCYMQDDDLGEADEDNIRREDSSS